VRFKILLEEAGLPADIVHEFVTHENAHANTAEQQAETMTLHGYGLVYFSENNEICSVQPCIMEDRKNGVTALRYIKSKLKVLSAPDRYGEVTSPDDRREIEMLEEIREGHEGNR
jgi:hypothetical protein